MLDNQNLKVNFQEMTLLKNLLFNQPCAILLHDSLKFRISIHSS